MSIDPDLTGRVCVVTGASRGIGAVTARRLAEMGATVAMVGRDGAALEAAAKDVRAASSADRVSLHLADFASLDEVRGLAVKLGTAYPRIDVLVNNAGLWLNSRQLSADGYEKTLAVNHLAPFLLTHLLLDNLAAAGGGARIVNVASAAHRGGKIDLTDLMLERSYNSTGAYARTKLANVLFTRELAKRLDPAAVTANACHPGAVRTDLGRDPGLSRFFYIAGAPFMIGVEKGASTQVYLASSPEVAGRTGGYYSRSRLRTPAPLARDDTLATWLWEESVRLTGV
jgi:NAD(P)-dependent dehydrogenase (short-subunit alcohol dehydrogenase family)